MHGVPGVDAVVGQERDHHHRGVGERGDRDRARREAVEAVGQVDGVGGAGDHQEDEHVVGRPEAEVRVQDRDVDVGREVLAMRHEPHAGDHEREQQELPAAREAERAPPRQLQVVVDEADRGARERRPGHRQPRPGVLGEDARTRAARTRAGRRRPSSACPAWTDVPRRPVLADVLAELVAAQEGDERGPGHDPEQHRDHAGGQHELHVSASTTVSRPADAAGLHEHRVAGAQERRPARPAAAPASAYQAPAVAAAERADGDDQRRRRAAAPRAPPRRAGRARPGRARPSRRARRRCGGRPPRRPGGAAPPASTTGLAL